MAVVLHTKVEKSLLGCPAIGSPTDSSLALQSVTTIIHIIGMKKVVSVLQRLKDSFNLKIISGTSLNGTKKPKVVRKKHLGDVQAGNPGFGKTRVYSWP